MPLVDIPGVFHTIVYFLTLVIFVTSIHCLELQRSMVGGVKANSKIDSLWNLLTTPGYNESIGMENIYKSQMNIAHTSNKDFEKSVRHIDCRLLFCF